MRLFASPLFMIILFLFIGTGLFLFWYLKQIKIAKRQTISILQKLEAKYQQIIQQRMTLLVLEDKDMESEQAAIEEEVLTILQPEVEALLAHVNTLDVKDSALGYNSSVFSNLPRLTEDFLEQRQKNPSLKLGQNHQDQVIQALNSGMKADFAQRVLNWKTGQTYSS